jgi:hypothetical protein
MNFFAQSGTIVSSPTAYKKDITFITQEKILCKLVVDPRSNPHAGAVKVRYFEYSVNGNKYKTPCRESLGLGKDARFEKFKALNAEYFEACEAHGPDSKEAQTIKAKRAKYQPKDGCYLYYVVPNGNTIQCMKASITLHDKIFGRKGSKTFKEIVSIQDTLAKKGKSLYLTGNKEDNKTGWVNIYKTGTGLGTEYHIVEATTTKQVSIDGAIVDVPVPATYEVDAKIYDGLDTESLPNPLKYEQQYVWTEEEVNKFVESEGTEIPPRVLEKMNKAPKGTSNADTDDDAGCDVPPPANLLGDIPF